MHRNSQCEKLVSLILLLVLGGCQLQPSNGWPRTGVLRGPVIVYIGFRLGLEVPAGIEVRAGDAMQEGLSVSTDHTVVRSVVPITTHTPIRQAMIPDPLWESLMTLQQDWCRQPPPAAQPTADPERYDITIKCDGYTPVYSLAPADLPPALRQLLQVLP